MKRLRFFPLLIVIAVLGCTQTSEPSLPQSSKGDISTQASPSEKLTSQATNSQVSTEDTPKDTQLKTVEPTTKQSGGNANSSALAPSGTKTATADRAVWIQHYSDEFPYVNATSGSINVRNGPSTDTAVAASLAPGEGGYVQTCSVDLDWCQLNYGGSDQTGWVSMELMSGHVDPVSEVANASCVVEGASIGTRFEGDCIFTQSGGNGSFSIESPSGLIDGRSLISVSIVSPGIADVSGLTVDGFNSRWGEAKRSSSDSACWVGNDFTICAR